MFGPKARVAQVKVDPQSGVCLASSRNANAVSIIGTNPITNSAGVLAPTTATKPASTAGIGIVALVIGRERRSQAGRRKLAFEDASRQVAFAAERWNASKLVASSPDDQERASARARPSE